MIFLDNASTTRVFDKVTSTMSEVGSVHFYNPSALYRPAIKVREIMEQSRKVIADRLSADKSEIVFSSCATECNNWVLQNGQKNKKGNMVISAGEHASVYDSAMFLKSRGADVRVAGLLPDGRLDTDDLVKKLDADTSLVSIIHCSNETGAINDLPEIVRIIRKHSPNALIHSDGVQAFCKMPTDLRRIGVDFYTVSAHKIGGPRGCGALYINKKVRIAPFIHGGGQENGLRSGTENTAGIAGFAAATEVFQDRHDSAKMHGIFDFLRGELCGDGWIYNGAEIHSGFILSMSYKGIKSEVLQHMLEDDGLLIGLGSACSSKSVENRVLSAMGRDKKSIEGNIRLSFCVDTTMQEAESARTKIKKALDELKSKLKL